jgi:hypothetical protein
MKGKIAPFLSGALASAMLIGLPVTALATSGTIHIDANPISILVNGEEFQPKDASGNDVEVFCWNGTTYAPLRALAEAYGLEVSYDSEKNIAVVNSPSNEAQTASSSFASAWTISEKPVTNYGDEKIFTATYNGSLGMSDFKTWWKSFSMDEIEREAEQLAAEAQSMNPGYKVTMYFSYGSYNLGTAYAFGTYEQSNFKLASIWIK